MGESLVMTIVVNRQTGAMTPVGNLGVTGDMAGDILVVLQAFSTMSNVLQGQLQGQLRGGLKAQQNMDSNAEHD